MADQPNNPHNLDLSGVIRGADGPAESRSNAASDERGKFEPKAYYFGAWHLLKHDLFIFLWKLGADVVRTVLWIGTALMIGVVVMAGLADSIEAPQGPLFGVERFVEKLATPAFVIGVAGALFCAWLISLMIDVLVLSGVWGTLACGVRGEPIARFRTFFANLTTRFPRVLSLRLTTLAAQATLVLLAITVFVSVLLATTGNSAFADSSIWTRGLLWATPLTLLAGLVALVRLTMEVAAAPLLLEGRSLGDSILTAARLVIRRFSQVYRLLIVAAGMLLIPLFLYWGVLIFGNLTMDVAALAPINVLLRLAGEFILFVSTGAIALLFYAAIFLYYGHQMGMIDDIPGRDDDNDSDGPVAPSGGDRPGRVSFGQDTELEDLLPIDYPNVVALDDVLGSALPETEPAPDPESDPEPEPEPAPQPEQHEHAGPQGDGLSGDDAFDTDDDPDNHDRD